MMANTDPKSEINILRKQFVELEKKTAAYQRNERWLIAFNQASQAMSRALTPEEIFETVSTTFKNLGLACIIYSIDSHKENLKIASFTYPSQTIKSIEKLAGAKAIGYTFPVDSVEIYHAIIENQQTQFIHEPEDALRQMLPKPIQKFGGQIIKLLNISASINAPLISRDEIIGLISVQADDLIEEDVPIFTAFANQVAAVWHKAQLYQHAQHEIAERTQAEAALRDSEARFKSIVEGQIEYVVRWLPDGTRTFVNQAYAHFLNRSQEELIGTNFFSIIPEEDAQKIQENLKAIKPDNPIASYENRIILPDDSEHWIQWNDRGIFDQDDNLIEVQSVGWDITKRITTENALRESEERFKSIIQTSPMGMHLYQLESDGRLILIGSNPAANQILGTDNTSLLGKTIEEAFPSLSKTEIPERYRQAASRGESWKTLQLSYEDQQISGAYEVYAVQTSPGKMAAIFLDVTDRKKHEQILQQRATQLTLLNKVGEQIVAVLDLERVFERAVELVQESFGYHHVGIFTIDPVDQKLIMQARSGEFNHLFPDHHVLDIGQGMVGWTAQNNQTLLSNDVSTEQQFVNLYPDTLPTRSELCVPIHLGEQVIGVLDAQSHQKNAFDDSDVIALQTMAGQIATAIENARLHTAVRRELNDRQRAEEDLRESEERYRLMVERSSDAIFMFNPKSGHYLDANQAAEQISGRTLSELKQLTTFDLAPNNAQERLQLISEKTNAIDFGEVEYHRPDQSHRTALMSAVRIKENLAFEIARDITERKQMDDALHNVAAGVSATTGTKFFEKLVEYLATSLNVRYAFVGELVNEGQIQTKAVFKDGVIGSNFQYELENTPSANIIEKNAYCYHRNVQQLFPLDLILAEMNIDGYAGTPLIDSSGECIGLLVVMDDQGIENPDLSQSLLRIFALRVAAELERLNVEAELQRRANQLSALNQMGQLITSSLNIEQVLDQVIHVVPPLVAADGVSILLKENPREMIFAAASGRGAKNLKGQVIPADAGIAGQVLANQQPVLIRQQPKDQKRLYRDIEKVSSYHTQSLIAVPLGLGEETIGVMEAVHIQPNAFDQDDLQILETAGAWASIAIVNARQHAATERRLKETQAMAAINQALNETLDLDQLLQLIVDSINQTIPHIERTVIHLYDEVNDILIPTAVSGVEPGRKPYLQMQAKQGIAGQVIESGLSINVRDTTAEENFVPIDGAYYLKSLLVVPVQSSGRRLGTISVSSAIKDAFTTEDEHLLTILGVQAALAIESARLYTTTRQRLSETNTLYFISNLIVKSPELEVEDILYQVVDLLWQEFGYYHVHVYLIDQGSGALIANQGSGPIGAKLKQMGYQFTSEEGIVGYAATIGEPFMTNEVTQTHFYRTNPLLPDTKAELAAPLKARDQLLGVLDIQHQAPNSFDDDDFRFLVAVADQLAVVLDKALLYKELEAALTKEKRTRDRLVQAEKLAAMGRLIASVAHELNNPLQAIQNALYLVKLEESLSSQAREDIQVAIDEGARMAGLIARLRDTYRPTIAADFQLESVNILIEEVQKLIETHLRHNNVRLEFLPELELPKTRMIRDQIKQVILNLCINGIESMPDGGDLTIRSIYHAQEEQILIHVIDTGAGLPPGTQSQIFEPFFTTKEGGTGLGLAVSYEIIQNHGGDIIASNNSDAKGATFTIMLPTT